MCRTPGCSGDSNGLRKCRDCMLVENLRHPCTSCGGSRYNKDGYGYPTCEKLECHETEARALRKELYSKEYEMRKMRSGVEKTAKTMGKMQDELIDAERTIKRLRKERNKAEDRLYDLEEGMQKMQPVFMPPMPMMPMHPPPMHMPPPRPLQRQNATFGLQNLLDQVNAYKRKRK